MRTVFDAPWWLAIAVGYVIATSTHFVLHRKVTFAKDEFQLTPAQQAWRFIAVVVCSVRRSRRPRCRVLPSSLITFFCVAACRHRRELPGAADAPLPLRNASVSASASGVPIS